MSKVVITGNASGTGDFTIEAPNSNTDRTLTLPDETGTYGTTSHERGEDFTPYVDLTEDQVIGWVKATLDEPAIEASLAAQIEAKKNPTTATGVPW
jgi:hypothetical protein